jgi:hypothetical protein
MATTKTAPVKNDALDSILKQYEENSTSSSSGKSYDLKNYFTVRLADGEKSGSKRIRILPAPNGGSPFVEVYIHKLQINGVWKKFICLNHMFDKDCPFCEAREALLATGKAEDKELAKNYGSRRAYVLKVIDREAEEEGVKFWRFNHDYRNEGIFDKIIGIFKNKKDITDVTTGRDLTIEMTRNQKNNTIINAIIPEDAEPLSADAELSALWLADARTWEDVYAVKNYEYLEIVVKGGEPVWDKVGACWADKATIKEEEKQELDAELSIGAAKVETPKAAPVDAKAAEKPVAKTSSTAAKAPVAKATVKPTAPVVTEEPDDDLPF